MKYVVFFSLSFFFLGGGGGGYFAVATIWQHKPLNLSLFLSVQAISKFIISTYVSSLFLTVYLVKMCLGLNLSISPLPSFLPLFWFLHVCPLLFFLYISVQFFAFPCTLFFLSPSLSGRSRRCNWLCCCWGFVLRRALIFSFTQNAKWRLEAVRDFTRLPRECVCVCVPVSHSALTNCTRSECILIHAPNKLYKVFVWCTVTSLCVCLCVCVCVNEAILLSPNYSSFLTTVKLHLKTKKVVSDKSTLKLFIWAVYSK